MKKLLLSLSAAVACMSVSAAVPVLKEQYKGSFDVAAEKATYSNPSAYDAQGNLIITGKFKNEFTFNGVEVTGEGVNNAFIVKYDSANAPKWAAALAGSATVTAVDTDAQGNIYVGGSFAGKVDFLSATADGEPSISKEGRKVDDTFVSQQTSSFIAKYSADGEVKYVTVLVPEKLPAIVAEEATFEKFYFSGAEATQISVSKIQVNGSKLYVATTFSGETKIDDITLSGSYMVEEGWLLADEDNAAIISFNSEDLTNCQIESEFYATTPGSSTMSNALSPVFGINGDNLIVGYVGIGDMTLKIGSESSEVNTESQKVTFVLASSLAGTPIVKTVRENSLSQILDRMSIVDILVDGGKAYAVGTYAKPEVKSGDDAVAQGDDMFVTTLNANSMAVVSEKVFDNDEGTTNGKPNYEVAKSAQLVDGAIYINSAVYDFDQNFLNTASYWFDGSAFSVAPATGTGIAVGKGVMALATSDATQVGYTTYTFEQKQTAITDIEAEFDENAPVEYFNLQGIRVDNPSNGLYIRRQGNKVEKILVK